MLGQRLRFLRHERKLTQEALGKILGVGKTAISQYEKGTRKPDADMLKRMAEFFNVSADFLLGLTDKKIPLLREQSTNYAAPSEEEEMLSRLPDEARQSLQDFKEYIIHKYGQKKKRKVKK